MALLLTEAASLLLIWKSQELKTSVQKGYIFLAKSDALLLPWPCAEQLW